MLRDMLFGLIAGAAGTTALNLTTYTDMAVRGRPASSAPADVATKLAERAGIDRLTGEGNQGVIQNRQSGVGALLGLFTGIFIGALYGLIRPRLRSVPVTVTGAGVGLAAMAGSDTPIAALKISDPRTWGASDWLSDIIPHLIYGYVTALVFDVLSRR